MNNLKQRNSRVLAKGAIAASALLGLVLSHPAQAWDVSVNIGYQDDAFSIDGTSGLGSASLSTVRRGVFASTGTNGFPNSWIYQNWDGNEWVPASSNISTQLMPGNGDAESVAYIDSFDEFEELSDGSEAFVSGGVEPGNAIGAGFAFDYTLTVDPFTTAFLLLDLFDTGAIYGQVGAETGDTGFGFATIKVYDPSIDLNDPNGANNPFDEGLVSLTAPVTHGLTMEMDIMNFQDIVFQNSGASAQEFSLRLEGTAGVFSPASAVPLPAPVFLLFSGLSMLLVMRRKQAA